MNWNILGYALLCIFAPVAWGLLVYEASTLIERRVLRKNPTAPRSARHRRSDEETLPLEYHI